MTYLIKELPIEERPRERFKKYGVKALSNEELISIILRTGSHNKSVKELSTDLLKKINIHELNNTNYQQIKNIKGIGEVKAITLLSAIELGKRVTSKKEEKYHITSSKDVYDLIKNEMINELQEKLIVLYLDNRNNLIDKKTIFIGTVNQSSIHPRDVFREAVKLNSVKIILSHNHPAGSIEPSYSDLHMTNKFISIGKLMEIEVLDHLIIGNNDYYSFKESNGDLFEKN